MATRWDLGKYATERECTCKSRSAECVGYGYHVVDSTDDLIGARAETARLSKLYSFKYRTVNQHSREQI